MARNSCIIIKTQQDIQAACKRMDDRERELLNGFGDEVTDSEYEERASWAHKLLSRYDDDCQ